MAAAFADPRAWRRFWPDLELEVYADRGDEGLRWTVRGALVGTMEVWLEPVLDGTLLHYFLRADLAARRAPPGTAAAGDTPAASAPRRPSRWTSRPMLEDGRRPASAGRMISGRR